jgi:adenine-specific DNA-methyltransferase
MIKYLGSKRRLLDRIVAIIAEIDGARSVVDLFSGTSRVGHALKGAGFRVLANDHNAYAHTLATCYVAADREAIEGHATRLIAELQAVPPAPGYFTQTFCEEARFFQPRNGAKVDAIREAIAAKELPAELEAVLLVSLMEAADRVDSTTGVQMAYLKSWAPRANRPLELRLPDVLPRARHGKGEAHRLEAVDAAARLRADVVYVDPPYNQHSYLGNYHIWETLVRWDRPEAYGRARKRVDCRARQSPFNSKRRCRAAFAELFAALDAPTLVVSFNNEGFLDRDELLGLLAPWGEVEVIEVDYRRYVGAQIGIYNPQGAKVGEVSHVRNKELIFVAGRGGPEAARRACAALADAR